MIFIIAKRVLDVLKWLALLGWPIAALNASLMNEMSSLLFWQHFILIWFLAYPVMLILSVTIFKRYKWFPWIFVFPTMIIILWEAVLMIPWLV